MRKGRLSSVSCDSEHCWPAREPSLKAFAHLPFARLVVCFLCLCVLSVSSTRSGSSFKPSRHCYYHGHVAGDPQSWVALSTCHGLSGVVHANGNTFAIAPSMAGGDDQLEADGQQQDQADEASKEPRRHRPKAAPRHMHSMSASPQEQHEKMTHEHVIYRLSDYKPLRTVCGVTEEQQQHPLQHLAHAHAHAHAAHSEAVTKNANAGATPANPDAFQNVTTAGGTSGVKITPTGLRLAHATAPADGSYAGKKYLELLIINDYDRKSQHGSSTEHDSLALGKNDI